MVRTRLGAIMRNPVRTPRVTCAMCTGPVVAPYILCYRCNEDSRNLRPATAGRGRVPVARRIIPLTYAVYGEQSNIDMHRYKDAMPDSQRLRNPSYQRVLLLVLGFAVTHARCLDRVAAQPVTRLAVVPSLRGRPGRHPLVAISDVLPPQWKRVDLQPVGDLPEQQRRTVSADHFVLPSSTDVMDQHVVVLDDTWVTGGHAQSAAATILCSGAAEVTVVVVARRVRPGQHSPAEEVLREIIGGPEYTLDLCPVTGATCP